MATCAQMFLDLHYRCVGRQRAWLLQREETHVDTGQDVSEMDVSYDVSIFVLLCCFRTDLLGLCESVRIRYWIGRWLGTLGGSLVDTTASVAFRSVCAEAHLSHNVASRDRVCIS